MFGKARFISDQTETNLTTAPRWGLRWYSGKSPATLVIHRLFPAVEVVGSNPAPPFSRPAARAETPVHSSVCSFRILTSTLKTPYLTSEHLFTCCDNR